jgi:hypothetical protein
MMKVRLIKEHEIAPGIIWPAGKEVSVDKETERLWILRGIAKPVHEPVLNIFKKKKPRLTKTKE